MEIETTISLTYLLDELAMPVKCFYLGITETWFFWKCEKRGGDQTFDRFFQPVRGVENPLN